MAIGDGVSAIASLAVTFGGFSPTAMDGVAATRAQVERVEAAQKKRKLAEMRKRELERARTSSEKIWKDDFGATWRYVVIDGGFVRLEKCETQETVIRVPEYIEDLPVYSIAADCCSKIDSVQELICPNSIEQIGSNAFRICPNLRRVVLPDNVSSFNATWFQKDKSIEELTLPGLLETIKSNYLDLKKLRKLHIGKNVRSIEPGAFRNTGLDELTIDPDNPFIKSDGIGIYTYDGKVLLAVARPVESYRVSESCVSIGKKAFDGHMETHEVLLPERLQRIEEFAFTHAGLRHIAIPPLVNVIEEKAFYYCKELRSIELNEGLESIGDSAFEESALEALHIPASIEHIGNSITMRTPIVYRGPNCTLEIDKASKSMFIDQNGGLYRRQKDGIHLVQLMDRETEEFTTIDDVAVIDDHAISHHYFIKEVHVARGARIICDNAFRHCPELEYVELPDTIESIGANAFMDTALTRFRLPKACTNLGTYALVTSSVHHGDRVPTLRSIEVAEGNERFYMACGMLCRHDSNGDWVVMFSNSQPDVIFPNAIVGIEEYAFNNARDIRYLALNPELKTIKASALTTWCWIERIHVETAEPLEGRTSFDFEFPNTAKSLHGISNGIGGASWVNVPGIMAQYDMCVIHAHDYNSPRNPDGISIYEQVKKVLERLSDPILLADVNRGMYERLLRNYIIEICVDIARHDDRDLINELVDLGYVNNDNLEDITLAVGELQDAAMTGYLLELKRRRFGRAAFDFDL